MACGLGLPLLPATTLTPVVVEVPFLFWFHKQAPWTLNESYICVRELLCRVVKYLRIVS